MIPQEKTGKNPDNKSQKQKNYFFPDITAYQLYQED
jgi:hypothetical protein